MTKQNKNNGAIAATEAAISSEQFVPVTSTPEFDLTTPASIFEAVNEVTRRKAEVVAQQEALQLLVAGFNQQIAELNTALVNVLQGAGFAVQVAAPVQKIVRHRRTKAEMLAARAAAATPLEATNEVENNEATQ